MCFWFRLCIPSYSRRFNGVAFFAEFFCMTSIFSALTLLVRWEEGHPACKNWVVRYRRGYLSGARCKWFAYVPDDAPATPLSLAPVKSRMVYLSGADLTRFSACLVLSTNLALYKFLFVFGIVLEKRPLNGFGTFCVSTILAITRLWSHPPYFRWHSEHDCQVLSPHSAKR